MPAVPQRVTNRSSVSNDLRTHYLKGAPDEPVLLVWAGRVHCFPRCRNLTQLPRTNAALFFSHSQPGARCFGSFFVGRMAENVPQLVRHCPVETSRTLGGIVRLQDLLERCVQREEGFVDIRSAHGEIREGRNAVTHVKLGGYPLPALPANDHPIPSLREYTNAFQTLVQPALIKLARARPDPAAGNPDCRGRLNCLAR